MKTEFKFLNWSTTNARRCRWSEYAFDLIDNYAIIWEESYAYVQGNANVLAYKNNKFVYIQWRYGSCSGCDSYDDLSTDKIAEEFNKDAMRFSSADSFCTWLKMLEKTKDKKYFKIKSTIDCAFNDKNINWIDEPDKLKSKLDTLLLLST